MWGLLLLAFVFVGLSWQQQDPVTGFCRRWGHQTAVIDNKLWIDGGQVNWNPPGANISNTWLLYNDLNTSPSPQGMPQLVATNYKNATIPDTTGGVLWEDTVNKRFYLYGGEYLNSNANGPNPVNLWSFDTLYNFWSSYGAPAVTAQVSGVSYAGHVAISSLGLGYALGGWMSNLTVPGWNGDRVASSGLIKYDMATNLWTNSSGPDTIPRAEGTMVYVPASDNGLLIYFGGVTAPYYNSTMIESPMSSITVYDITSSKWYTQTATGQIPPNRRRFCAGATWAQDQSSYNIYIYGGLGFGVNATGFDDVWILSLPSFTWTQWYVGTTPSGFHHSLSCNVVNHAQMLIIGGSFPASGDCDSPLAWGTHGLDLGKSTGSMWALFKPNLTTYKVPPEIISVVGGAATGGATATAPASGFQSPDLAVYFTQRATAASRTPTRMVTTSTPSNAATTSSKSLSTGAIAGIAVGGAIVLIALLFGGFCLLRRRRRRNAAPQQQHADYPNPNYSVVSQAPHSLYTPGGSYRPQVPVQQEYHETAAVVPVELAASGNGYHSDPTKSHGIHQLPAEQHPAYSAWQGSPTTPPPPHALSPAQSVHSQSYFNSSDSNTHGPYSPAGDLPETSPAPTYSSVGRANRKPLPNQNQTYYSP